MDDKVKTIRVRGQVPLPVWARLVIILCTTIPYILTFHFLTGKFGSVGAALVIIPVVLTGFFFGIRIGIGSGLLGVLLSTLLFVKFQGGSWMTWVLTGWPGHFLVIASGLIAGLLKQASIDRIRLEGQLYSRERFLALINSVTRNILHPKDSEDIYYFLITHLVRLFAGQHAYLVSWEQDRQQTILVSATIPLKGTYVNRVLEPAESEVILSALQNGRALVIDNVKNSPYVINPPPFRELSLSTESALVIPFIAGEFKFGAAVIAFNSPRRFNREELIYAELASNQIALALWTSQQNIKVKIKLKEAVTLASIERVLSETERVGINKVLQIIVDSAKDLIPGAKYAVLHLLDAEQKILIPSAVAGFKNSSRAKLNMRLGEGVAGQAIATRKTISVPDTEKDPRFLNQAMPIQFRSLIVAPIQSNERCVGAISIQSEKSNAFTIEESQLLGALGTQAAIAIENSSLLETTQRNLKEINALYHISQRLAASLDPDELMKDVVDRLALSFGYYHVQIFVVDPSTSDLVLRQGSGKIGENQKAQGHRLPVGAGIVGHTAETHEAFVTNNAEAVVFFLRNALLPNTNSEMTIPIKMEGQLLGVLDIQQTLPSILTTRDMQMMISVADQLAVSLQKANLYSELQTSLSQEKATRSQLIQSERLAVIGRLLASVSHELNNPLQAIQNVLFLLKKEKLTNQGRQDMELILSETERMAALIDRLRTTYRPTRSEDFQPIQLNSIVKDVYALTSTHMRHQKINFTFLPDPDLPEVPGIPEQIRQVVLNLFLNAVEAMPAGGQIMVSTEAIEQSFILLSVNDSGPGVAPELLPHIFEPFITNKETGTGLGLTITYDIIRQHQGDIHVENNPQGGAMFIVRLPLKEAQQ